MWWGPKTFLSTTSKIIFLNQSIGAHSSRVVFDELSFINREKLEKHFSIQYVKAVIWNSEPDKSPCSHRFNMSFLK